MNTTATSELVAVRTALRHSIDVHQPIWRRTITLRTAAVLSITLAAVTTIDAIASDYTHQVATLAAAGAIFVVGVILAVASTRPPRSLQDAFDADAETAQALNDWEPARDMDLLTKPTYEVELLVDLLERNRDAHLRLRRAFVSPLDAANVHHMATILSYDTAVHALWVELDRRRPFTAVTTLVDRLRGLLEDHGFTVQDPEVGSSSSFVTMGRRHPQDGRSQSVRFSCVTGGGMGSKIPWTLVIAPSVDDAAAQGEDGWVSIALWTDSKAWRPDRPWAAVEAEVVDRVIAVLDAPAGSDPVEMES